MSKLLSVLIAGLFAAGAAMAQGATPGAGSTAGSKSTAAGTNTNTNTASSTNANLNSNTNTNTVNVFGLGSRRLARQQAAAGQRQPTGMLPGRHQQMAANDKPKDKPCPPGLEKKNNGCMPPGQANHQQDTHARNHDTRAMGAGARHDRDEDRDHEHGRGRDRDRDDHRQGSRHGGHGEH
jgi:hypothetical protein